MEAAELVVESVAEMVPAGVMATGERRDSRRSKRSETVKHGGKPNASKRVGDRYIEVYASICA